MIRARRSPALLSCVAAGLVGLAGLRAIAVADGASGLWPLESAAFAADGKPAKDDHTGEVEQDSHADEDGAHSEDHSEDHGAHGDEDHHEAASCKPATLAERAGLTANEIQVLTRLAQRRREIDQREEELTERMSFLDAAEGRIAERVEELKRIQGRIEQLLGQLDGAEEAEVLRLVSVYEKMKPKSAAAIFSRMDDDTLIKVASRLKDQNLSLILSAMPQEAAVNLTVMLANQHIAPETLADAAAALGEAG